MRKLLLLFTLISGAFGLKAQGNFQSENGLFSVNYLKGCVGTEIEVTERNTQGASQFICFDADLSDIPSNNGCLGSAVQDPEDYRFTYQEAGTYKILFLDQLGDNQTYDSITIEIIEPSAPFVAISTCDNEVFFDINAQEEDFDIYNINFGDGTVQDYSINQFPFSYQYADPTIEYTLSVVGRFDNSGNNNCNNDSFTKTFIPIDQTESAASINSIVMLSENSFEIAYETNENQIYQLQIKQNTNGNYQTIENISNTGGGTLTFENRNLLSAFYCARIISTSQCTGDELISNEVCTIRFSAQANVDGNLLDWNHFTFQNSDLLKNGEVIYSGNAPYLDVNVLCGQEDIYQVRTIDSEGIEVISLLQSVSAITGSPTIPITQIATNVLSDSELELTWEVPQGLQPEGFIIFKKRNIGDEFFEADTATTNSYVDVGIAFYDRLFYYSVAYVNSCGGISPLRTTAENILLQVNQNESELTFAWNGFGGFDSLLREYVIIKYDENMNVISEENVGLNEFYGENIAQSDDQLSFYQVEAYSDNGLVAYSNLLRYKIPSSFFVPSGFTPNQDALNEEIKVVGKFIEEVEFSIYNRWGTLIFRSNSIEIGWDGYLPNRPAPAGTYTYTVRVTDEYGEVYNKSGVFNLIR
ncbi:T9SS type B sorting domain-containing protein [Marivirga sp.]|uniref:T9SS type B sorting domain-containing protein n=1 Tax=Marivirga sp. TaxID=2018662 RepID=UPI002D803C22|nr:T9SS type B sorting domain-containing protein [Marivirga sp.]HET8861231.1 T9SS type B sorting domain-containing protein [Marivirga sp.]